MQYSASYTIELDDEPVASAIQVKYIHVQYTNYMCSINNS